MSLLSRIFRKAPPPMAPAKPAENAQPVPPVKSVPDYTLVTAQEEEALRAAIEAREGTAIARWVVEGTSTKVRQLAAQAVEDPVVVRQLIRDVRGGHDKSVYKILTAKRDVQLAQARKAGQLAAEIGATAAAIERHSHRTFDPLFTPTLEQLEIRWTAVAEKADPDVAAQVQQAIDSSREVIAQHLRQIALAASRELAAANAAAEAQRLRELEEKAAAVAAAERAGVLEEQRRAQAQQQEVEAQALRQIGGLIRKALGALHEGSTGRAAGLRRAIEEKLPTTPPLSTYLANQLQQLDTKLDELKDWKSFSVAPKRVELMEEMESLVGATLEPPVLAERIKGLQEEWRTLSKGAGENVEADWQRFQQAAQLAFQPCREYFEAQALLRQENLQRREALLARLMTFEAEHDWEHPDWRTVITALRDSKQQWRRYSPVERAAGKALQDRFTAVSLNLQNRLDGEYTRNVTAKRLLIERAKRLAAGEDSRLAVDEVKDLQREWRHVGQVPRDEDLRLWEEFRQHCDAVFQKRQQDFVEYTAGLEANKSKAITLCEELERIAALRDHELLEGAKSLAELHLASEAIGELPRGVARELRGRFERALERCEKAVAHQKMRAAERIWTDLFEAANRVRAYRLGFARNADTVDVDALRQSVHDYIASVTRWPKRGLEAIKAALDTPGVPDVTANETALRTLCIRAEILTERTTPVEDQALRRQYQVQRLIQVMGQGITADKSQLDTLAIEWIGVGPVDEATYLQLLTRFKQCRQS